MQFSASSGGWGFKATAVAATLLQPSSYIGAQTMTSPTAQPAPAPAPTAATSFVDEKLLASKLETVEARTETKFAQLLGELKVISANMSSVAGDVGGLKAEINTMRGEISNVDKSVRQRRWEIIVALVTTGLAIAALCYASVQIFQGGMGAGMTAMQAAIQAHPAPPAS